ncbi:MAG: SAM-dependent methyltransferase [Lactobacillus kefiranofaciens]|nr:SAM-dependent methyltransferase [Lactobacillus kefiranofaciens subsp. kefirgranum DSM 10550 = JCM 8572]KRM23065.1 SAM-dependent methyltransferase [Lactobacillus kefiranofaciens subsp. kefiranofaciens DSM 5016 = JCM 6985]
MVKSLVRYQDMTKFLTKLTNLDKKISDPLVHKQVEEITRIDNYVQQGRPLPRAPRRLGLLPDEFENILVKTDAAKKEELTVMNNLLNNFRQYLSLKYGIWSVANLKTAKLIKEKLEVNSALEIMAGNAYWSKALAEVGINVISTDSLEWAKTSTTGAQPFYPVIDLPAQNAVQRYAKVDLIICSWSPNFGHSDLDAIQAWKKYNPSSHLLFIGEKNGATNSPAFWQRNHFIKNAALAEINQSFQSFDFINEQVFEIDNEL